MAGDWIKLSCSTPDKPEMVAMANRLGIDQDAVVGKCVRLWIWADQQSVNGNGLSVTQSFLDRITYCTGFAQALISVGWLTVDGDCVTIPNFDRHNGKTAKTRALTNDRVASSRKGKRECNDASVTRSLPEKRREEIKGTDVVIPMGFEIPEAQTAAANWFQYLGDKGWLDKIPERNSPQEQAFWDLAYREHGTPEAFVEAVTYAMANGNRTLSKRRGQNGRARTSSDWLEAQKAVSIYPNDWEKRLELLGPDRFEALKRTGTAKVREATHDLERKSLGEVFESHLADIRAGKGQNGTTASH